MPENMTRDQLKLSMLQLFINQNGLKDDFDAWYEIEQEDDKDLEDLEADESVTTMNKVHNTGVDDLKKQFNKRLEEKE